MRGLDKMQKSGERAARRIGQTLRSVGTGMTAALTAPLAGAGALAVKTAADYESLRQSMDILNQSAEEGARNFERLKEFSAETPFQLRDLAEAQNMLQGFGLSADEAFQSMKMIGDISAVASGDIKGIGIAFGQAAAEGRVMTRDIRQLINQGVPAIKLLADTMDVATSDVLNLASEGKISFEILQQSFRDATEEGGMFADGMKKQANTLKGVFSTLKDRVSLALGDLGDVIADTLDLKQIAKDVGQAVRQIAKRFEAMSDESQKQILKIAGLIGAGGPLLIGLGQAAIAVSAFAKLVRTRFALVTGSVALLAGIVEQQGQLWAKILGDSEKEVDNFTTSVRKGMSKIISPLIDFTEEALGAGQALDEFRNLLSNLGKEGADSRLESTQRMLNFINTDIDELISGLGSAGKIGTLSTEIESAAINTQMLASNLQKVKTQSTEALAGMTAKVRPAIEGMSAAEVATTKLSNEMSRVAMIGQQMGVMIGDAFTRAVVQGRKLGNILSSIARQLASKAIMTGLKFLLPGGPAIGGAGFFKTLFGGIFHDGGVVQGTGDKMIMAQGGEMVLTRSQQKALGGMINSGGQSSISQASMQRAFERALDNKMSRLGPDEVFAMNAKGSRGF